MEKVKILIVEDEAIIAKDLQFQLKGMGYDVSLIVATGEEAVNKAQEFEPDMVLMDIVLSGEIDGIEAANAIRSRADIPIIYLTAYATEEILERAKLSEPFGYLIKPVNSRELQSTIEMSLYKHSMEKELKRHRNHLKDLVKERTAELSKTNEQLQKEIVKHKQAEEDRKKLVKEIEAVNFDMTELNKELVTIGAERTMNIMALTVADKVRNPATVIGGLCRRILDKEKVSGRLGDNLNNIIEEANKLEEIVNDFQTLLKNKQSMFKLYDLNRTVKSVISVIKKDAASRTIKITADISEEPLKINMQKHLLRIALFHIMRNSIEATPEGGIITVKTFLDGDNAAIKVSDTGYGISREDVERIFDPFFSTKKSGFGMGLPLAKQILHEHLGELRLESKPGKGTVFDITFPIRWKEDTLIG